MSLNIESVNFHYGQTLILKQIQLSIEEGEFVCLLGHSGSGKSTLLHLLAGLQHPSSGKIQWKNQPIEKPSLDRGVVFQDYSLFPWMSMVDNIALAIGKVQPQTRKAERREQTQIFLKQVGLQDAIGKYPFELSGGMRQRGAIARALALGSPILLMDEPFGALDPINRARLQDLLLDVWQSTAPRKTIVFVTHDVDEAIYLADRVVILGSSPGHLIAQKTIPFARPRVRNQLFTTDEFHLLREEISEILSADTIARLNLTPSA